MTMRHIVATLLLSSLVLQAQNIVSLTPDAGSGSTGQTGQYTSQAIVNGNPAIAYYNVTEGNLMYARNSAADGSGTWNIVNVDYSGVVGLYAKLLVIDGKPAISYSDSTGFDLRYVRALDVNGTTWGTPVILDSTGQVGQFNSLAVVAGNPAISYFDLTNTNLKYVRALNASGTSWGTPLTVEASAGIVGQQTSLAVVDGNPAISYYDNTNGDLRYVRATDATGSAWGTPVLVDSTDSVGQFTSLVVVNGNPAISYYDVTNQNLKYVRATDVTGAAWATPLILASTGNVGSYTSMIIVGGLPAISCIDTSAGDLLYLRALDASGTTWGSAVTVDGASGNVGQFSSLLVVDGRPAISYQDGGVSDLKYARANDANGTTWAAATTLDTGIHSGSTGQYSSQAIVNGHPAIAYYDATNFDLRYVRALNAAGTAWGAAVTVDSTGLVGTFASLAVIDGRPAICYHDASPNFDLKYVRANDANGTTWGTPVTLDSIGTVGTHISLATINGRPAASYYDSTNADLKYIRASDATGTGWDVPVILDSTGTVGTFTSLATVNGRPAVSYHDNTNTNLKYIRASDADGTAWDTPQTVENSVGSVGGYTTLVVVNGQPAISYYDFSSFDLKYVRATDADGSTWGTPLTLDSTGLVGSYGSMTLIGGTPAVSYFDDTNDDLKYVRASDANGATWGTPVVLDSTLESVGHYTSIVEAAGNPAVSYYDVTNLNLKWATIITPLPDIAVAQSGAVADGGSVPFGTVVAGQNGTPLTFTLTNPGTADLTGLAVTKDGTDAADFTVSALSGTSILTGPGTVTFTVTFTPGSAGSKTAAIHIASNVSGMKNPFDITLTGTAQSVYEAWAIANSVSTDPTASGGTNLKAFAFGYTPGSPGALVYTGTFAGSGTITTTGEPVTAFEAVTHGVDFRALFVRRKDHVAAGLTYTPQFSPDLSIWQNSASIPTVLADDGTHQIVSVPYPFFISGKKARFFRLSLGIIP